MPCGPVSPVGPVLPIFPVGPTGPIGPVGPVAPVAPVGPVAPDRPVLPCGPVSPTEPTRPRGPAGPVAPLGPRGPRAPVGPWGPRGPRAPWTAPGVALRLHPLKPAVSRLAAASPMTICLRMGMCLRSAPCDPRRGGLRRGLDSCWAMLWRQANLRRELRDRPRDCGGDGSGCVMRDRAAPRRRQANRTGAALTLDLVKGGSAERERAWRDRLVPPSLRTQFLPKRVRCASTRSTLAPGGHEMADIHPRAKVMFA